MLKLTYTENDLHLELLGEPMEEWIASRVVFALRLGQGIYIIPSYASFLVPMDVSMVKHLQAQVTRQQEQDISVGIGDRNHLEISLRGTWISDRPHKDEGIFVTSLHYGVEFLLLKLWQEKQAEVVKQ